MNYFPDDSCHYGHLIDVVHGAIRDGRLKFTKRIEGELLPDDLDPILFMIFGVIFDAKYISGSIARFNYFYRGELEWLRGGNAFALFKAKLAKMGVIWDADHEPDFSGFAQADAR